jgi:hypothetical protein
MHRCSRQLCSDTAAKSDAFASVSAVVSLGDNVVDMVYKIAAVAAVADIATGTTLHP